MEILRRTPWSRIREQNSVYKEFLEIVGNGKPTGSVWKETIAVSATISISVEKLHHQIRVRILSCSKMCENHREPEVPEAGVPGSWPTLAKPTLANRVWPALFGDRVWPNRLWPALVFQWYGRLWPKPTLAKPSSTCVCVCLCVFVCVCVSLCVFAVWRGCWFQSFGLVMFGAPGTALPRTALPGTALPQDRPSPGPPKISLFFSPSPAAKFVLFFPLWVSSRWIVAAVQGHDPPKMRVSVGVIAAVSPPGFHTAAREPKHAHLSAPQTPPKFHEKTPREGRKERILRRDREKKREILGSPPFGPPPFGAHFFWVGPPTFRTPTLLHPPTSTQNTQKNLNN